MSLLQVADCVAAKKHSHFHSMSIHNSILSWHIRELVPAKVHTNNRVIDARLLADKNKKYKDKLYLHPDTVPVDKAQAESQNGSKTPPGVSIRMRINHVHKEAGMLIQGLCNYKISCEQRKMCSSHLLMLCGTKLY